MLVTRVAMVLSRAMRATSGILRDDAGGVATEYVVLVGAVGLVVVGALVALGPAYVGHYEVVRNLILIPAP